MVNPKIITYFFVSYGYLCIIYFFLVLVMHFFDNKFFLSPISFKGVYHSLLHEVLET